jgi:hypothetical protein
LPSSERESVTSWSTMICIKKSPWRIKSWLSISASGRCRALCGALEVRSPSKKEGISQELLSKYFPPTKYSYLQCLIKSRDRLGYPTFLLTLKLESRMENGFCGKRKFPLLKSTLKRLLMLTSSFPLLILFATNRSFALGYPNTDLSCYADLQVPVRR